MKTENKFTIEEQVQIGDFVHDCEAGIIIIAKPSNRNKEEVEMLITARCQEQEQLVGMILEVMRKDMNFAMLFKTAVMRYEMDMIMNRYTE